MRGDGGSLSDCSVIDNHGDRLALCPNGITIVRPRIGRVIAISNHVHTRSNALLTGTQVGGRVNQAQASRGNRFIVSISGGCPAVSFHCDNGGAYRITLRLGRTHNTI